MSTPRTLEERALAYVFGDLSDDDGDPGELVALAAADPSFDATLCALEADVRTFKTALGVSTDASVALARVAVLREEVGRHRRERAHVAPVIDLAARRRRRRWTAGAGMVALVAAALLTVVLRPVTSDPGPQGITAAAAQRFAEALVPAQLGFEGEALTPMQRGILVGLVQDLAVLPAGQPAASGERRAIAEVLAARAASGLDLAGDAAALRRRVGAGCAALLASQADVDACEQGRASYHAARDRAAP